LYLIEEGEMSSNQGASIVNIVGIHSNLKYAT